MVRFYNCLFYACLFCLLGGPLYAQKIVVPDAEPQGEVLVQVKTNSKDAIFRNGESIAFHLDLKSTYKEQQNGKVACLVTTDDGKPVSEQSIDVKLGSKGNRNIKFKLAAGQAGFYQVKFIINLSLYDDTIKRVFGVSPEKITSTLHRPADFDKFWKQTRDSLAKTPPQYKITEDQAKSNRETKVYLVEMHSWGNAVIKGWLTIPMKRPKHLPVRYRVPGYLVAMEPSLYEDDFAVFQINVRGNGNSKNAISTNGQQYDLNNIQSRDKYIYRAVFMDCMRGLDFIFDNAERFGLDPARISLDGGSQGGCLAIVVAALDKRIKVVTTEVPLFADFRNAVRISRLAHPNSITPIWYINNYLKSHPGVTYDKIFKVWDYFDPLNFAQLVACPVLMGVGLMDEICPPSCSFAMYNQLGTTDKERWISADKAHEVDHIYYRFQYVWLREHLLLP